MMSMMSGIESIDSGEAWINSASVNTQLGDARTAFTAQLKSATDDRAAIRMEIAAADGVVVVMEMEHAVAPLDAAVAVVDGVAAGVRRCVRLCVCAVGARGGMACTCCRAGVRHS